MPQILQLLKNHLVVHIIFSIVLCLIFFFVQIPVFLLQGLHTYIHPDNASHKQNDGPKAAIRRPSSSSDTQSALRKRTSSGSKSNEQVDFDESNAQIFRLTLDAGHLLSRLFFNDYRYGAIYFSLSLSNMVLHRFLRNKIEKDRILEDGSSTVVTIFALVSLCKIFQSLARISFEKSASRMSEKQWSLLLGIIGFSFGLWICFGFSSSLLDFNLISPHSAPSKLFFAFLMGCLACFLYVPAVKNARSFWLGSDQLRSNLDIVSCGRISRLILYANLLVGSFSSLLWVNQVIPIFINKSDQGTHFGDRLAGNLGFSAAEFGKLRIFCLTISGLLQLASLRQNLQMYLNEALLCWYQRLHASKSPDLTFSRAKVFLHNHYLCASVIQFLAPPLLLLSFLGLSQLDCYPLFLSSLLPSTTFLQNLFLLTAWWISFNWSAYTLAHLLLYRQGFLSVS